MTFSRLRQKGIGIAVVLCMLGILSVMCLTLGTLGISNLNSFKSYSNNVAARYAAIEGLNEACDRLTHTGTWSSGFLGSSPNYEGVPQNSGPGKYLVTFNTGSNYHSTNNFNGTGTVTGWGNISVPKGYVYIISTGNVNGRKQRVASLIKAPNPSLPPWNYAIFADQGLRVGGTAKTDSFNSESQSYPYTCNGTNGDIGTNATTNGISIECGGTADVKGDGFVGYGGDWATCTTFHGAATVTGSTTSLDGPVTMPVINDFVSLSPCSSTTDKTYSASATISSSSSYRNITIRASGGTVTIQSGGSFGDIDVERDCTVNLYPGRYGKLNIKPGVNATVNLYNGDYSFLNIDFGNGGLPDINVPAATDCCRIYIRGSSTETSVNLNAQSLVNDSYKPKRCQIYASSSITDFTINGSAEVYCAIYAPNADFDLNGGAKIFGSVVCKKTTKLNGGFEMHYDEELGEVVEESKGYATINSMWFLEN